VDLKVVKRRKDFIEAHIIETKKYDPQFADGVIFCPHYFIPKGVSEVNAGTGKIGCGGCKRQMMSYEKQLELKQQLVEEAFKKITKTTEIRFLPIIGSPLTQGYRNKIEFSFGVYKQQSPEYRERNKQQGRDKACPCPNDERPNDETPIPAEIPQYVINNER
jgi:tRNA/tmRNA/rRNA uracil-C5-methylase (TrmA/RlmC/RlmD family)